MEQSNIQTRERVSELMKTRRPARPNRKSTSLLNRSQVSFAAIKRHVAMLTLSLAWSLIAIRMFHFDLWIHDAFSLIPVLLAAGIVYATGVLTALSTSILIYDQCNWLERTFFSSVHLGAMAGIVFFAISWVTRVVILVLLSICVWDWISRYRKNKLASSEQEAQNQSVLITCLSDIAGWGMIVLVSLTIWNTPAQLQARASIEHNAAVYENKVALPEGYEHVYREWPSMNYEQKVKLLEMVIEYECKSELGCTMPVLVVEDLHEDGLLGTYEVVENTITIDLEHLEDDFPLVLDSVLHECRHVWQYATRNMLRDMASVNPSYLRLAGISEMAVLIDSQDNYEFSDYYNEYIVGDKGKEYYYQPIEYDARIYAKHKVLNLYPVVFGYMTPMCAGWEEYVAEHGLDPEASYG